MMKNVNIWGTARPAVLCSIALCFVLLCGCGERQGTILIGGEEYGREDSREGNSGKESFGKESGNAAPESPKDSGVEGETFIRVYVCGAVVNPGVVSVAAGCRAEDALRAAGGFREDAAREAVNLADWIEDGQMLYFPTAQEAEDQAAEEAVAASGLVNINTADAAGLCTLPGIGESRAADIIAYREKNGGFGSCEDIMQVPGIKTSVYEKICDKITVK